eukprot:13393843-Alexandrium_andersonii.AAC.1
MHVARAARSAQDSWGIAYFSSKEIAEDAKAADVTFHNGAKALFKSANPKAAPPRPPEGMKRAAEQEEVPAKKRPPVHHEKMFMIS